MKLKEKIIREYAKLKTVRQTYQEIADKVGCDKTYVYKVIKASNLTSVPNLGRDIKQQVKRAERR